MLARAGLLALAPVAEADLFAPPTNVPAGTGPLGLATGDFDHDGDRDMLTSVAGDQRVTDTVRLTVVRGPA
jgi:hypothetical protein